MSQSLLSTQLQSQEDNSIIIKNYIIDLANQIKIPNEKKVIIEILFENNPQRKNVKYLPIDYNWVLDPKYECVLDATMNLSGITYALSLYDFKDNISKFIVQYLVSTYNILKEGLKTQCCQRPPIINPYTNINHDSLVELARQIINDFTKNN